MWFVRFIAYHELRDPKTMGAAEVINFLEYLVMKRNVAVSTQNQALNALVFVYENILHMPLGDRGGFVRAKRPKRIQTVLTRDEVEKLLHHLKGIHGVMGSLLYGTGMRLMDCLRLRILDVDFDYSQIIVREGKGKKDRVVPLPKYLNEPLKQQIEKSKSCMMKILPKATVKFIYQMPCQENIQMRQKNYVGNMFFPAGNFLLTLVVK